MSDSTHTLVYRRFFAILFSVLPGLNLVLGVGALVLFLLNDIVGMEWGWALGIAAIVLSVMFILWIFIGLGVQKWAEEKPAGMLFGLNAPFIVADLAFMGWLFVRVVIVGPEEAEAATEGARRIVESLSFFV